jgi:hypothetical protein
MMDIAHTRLLSFERQQIRREFTYFASPHTRLIAYILLMLVYLAPCSKRGRNGA